MTLAALNGQPIQFPILPTQYRHGQGWRYTLSNDNMGTMDAANEQLAYLGNAFIHDGSSSKTLSSAGGKIHWLGGTAITFANAGTTVRLGLQGVVSASSASSPDDTFGAYKDLVGGTDTLTANAFHATAMATGTSTVTNNAPIAVVWNMTGRGGSDAVRMGQPIIGTTTYLGFPGMSGNTAGTWAPSSSIIGRYGPPCLLLEFDDGTFGSIMGGMFVPATVSTHSAVQSSSNPDEIGCRFVLPFAATLWGVEFPCRPNSAAGSGTMANMRLCSGAAATPTLVEQVDIDGFEFFASTNASFVTRKRFATPRDLTAGTTYYVSLRSPSTMTWTHEYLTYSVAGHMGWMPLGTAAYKVTREADTAGTGAFTEVTADCYPVTLLFSKLSDNAGGGGGLAANPIRGFL